MGWQVGKTTAGFFKNTSGRGCLLPAGGLFRGHEKEKDPEWQESASLDVYNEITKVMPGHQGFHMPHLEDYWGLAVFFKKDLLVLDHGEIFVHKQKGYDLEQEKKGRTAKNLQYLTLQVEDYQKLTIVNFHGLWNGQGKGDSEDRLAQSENIVSFLKTLNHSFILGGDFNLNPDTRSLKMFEDCGLRNLIKEYGITSTRTSFYAKENRYADYVFVSKGVNVLDFQVLPDEVSDHAPLCVKVSA